MNPTVQKYFQTNKENNYSLDPDKFQVELARSKGSVKGWDKGPEKLYLTLERKDDGEAWGFSGHAGEDLEHWGGLLSGVAVRRHEKGLWLSVASVRDNSCAQKAGLRKGDFITSINGRIVFHLKPEDVSRLVRKSGKVLYLDIERNSSKTLLYCNGLHQYSYNFLLEDDWELNRLNLF